ncbi:MAG: four helix bundle protein [Candidatus Coatesbacteria bacterium]|nr:four helix bundle protein [Candidatus Coatesbacteria bacterium]
MAAIKRFEDIEAWQRARQLTREIYRITSEGDCTRDYCLRDQLRRSAVSIMSNIAEGFERGGNREFVQFLAVAKGSCGELRSQLYIALDQGYIDEQQFNEMSSGAIDIARMVSGLIRYLKESGKRGSKSV